MPRMWHLPSILLFACFVFSHRLETADLRCPAPYGYVLRFHDGVVYCGSWWFGNRLLLPAFPLDRLRQWIPIWHPVPVCRYDISECRLCHRAIYYRFVEPAYRTIDRAVCEFSVVAAVRRQTDSQSCRRPSAKPKRQIGRKAHFLPALVTNYVRRLMPSSVLVVFGFPFATPVCGRPRRGAVLVPHRGSFGDTWE